MGEPQTPVDPDPLEGLEARLKSHAQAFESPLALTPARDYFGSHAVDGRDPSEQWNRKKQSKEEKRAAKRAKLDPANQKSALDVLKEKEAEILRKRKRKDDADEAMDAEAVGKRMKAEQDQDAAEARRREKAGKKKEKRERKKQKIASTKAKVEAKKAKKHDQDLEEIEQRPNAVEDGSGSSDAQAEAIGPSEMEDVDFSGLGGDDDNKGDVDEDMDEAASQHSSTPTTPIVDSPAFDLSTNHSAASSSSSIVPPSVDSKITEPRAKPTKSMPASSTSTEPRNSTPTKPADSPPTTSAPQHKLTRTEAQDRLRARIQEMRAQRKADGADGADGQPARTRAELVDQRRQADVKRKAAKKEQRQKEREEESRRREEQLRGSGSPLSSIDLFSPRSPQPSNFSFSRLAFQDGTAATSNLSDLREVGRKKGPQDPKTALQAAQSKQSRLSGYDAEKRGEIEEKDSWINARKKAQGARVRDDTSLLRKALKRKEKQKSKSEKEWNQRGEDVVKGREMKQKKRDANLAKRKEEKGSKGKKKRTPNGKKVRRPGFEGRFKA